MIGRDKLPGVAAFVLDVQLAIGVNVVTRETVPKNCCQQRHKKTARPFRLRGF